MSLDADEHEIALGHRVYGQDDQDNGGVLQGSMNGDRNRHQLIGSHMSSDDDMSMDSERDESMNNDENHMNVMSFMLITSR